MADDKGRAQHRRRDVGTPPRSRRGGSDGRRDRKATQSRGPEQRAYDGPPIPEDVDARMLDRVVRRGLSSLPEKLADRVARHLVAAGASLEDDPETAYQHAKAARARAARVAVVREACGETAYLTGRYAEALSELRAAKRMGGAWDYLPMMADCERALGRPERAIKLSTPEAGSKLGDAGRVELSIVVAGARRDLGQTDAAVRLLETEPLHTKDRSDWVARLRYAYADALLEAGRRDEAVEWFHRTVAVDGNRSTDAEDRLSALGADLGDGSS